MIESERHHAVRFCRYDLYTHVRSFCGIKERVGFTHAFFYYVISVRFTSVCDPYHAGQKDQQHTGDGEYSCTNAAGFRQNIACNRGFTIL